MSIGKRVADAIGKMEAGDAEGALFVICSAIDATATKEYGKSGRSTYKQFIQENFGLITDVGLGRRILNLHLDYTDPTGQMKKNADGSYAIQEIIYHAVRCGLYHDAKIPSDIRFHEEGFITCKGGILQLPDSLIHGLIIAVIVSPVNHGETTGNDPVTRFGELPIMTNLLWGRRTEVNWLLEAKRATYAKHLEAAQERERNANKLPA